MQNVLPLTPGNPLKNITGLARQISLPGEHAPLRFPSFPALERTAVIGFNTPSTLELQATTPIKVMVARQAAYPVWAEAGKKYRALVGYPALDAITQSSPAVGQIGYPIGPSVVDWTLINRQATADKVGMAGSPADYDYPIMGRDGPDAEWVYVPEGASYAFVAAADTAVASGVYFTVSAELWRSPGERVYDSTTYAASVGVGYTAGMTPNTIAGDNLWIRPIELQMAYPTSGVVAAWRVYVVVSTSVITWTPSTATMGSVTLNPTTTTIFMPIATPNEFRNSALPWYATRVTAAAMLGTNVTQVLNKGGTVLGGRVSPAVQNPFTVLEDYIANLHPAEKAFLPLETGVYTYCPPSTDLVFFSDYTLNTGSGAAVVPLYNLSNDSLVNVMFLTAGSATESLAVTSTWHIEFRTSSALFQIGLSAMTLESLHQAQLVLAENGFFFENPEHEGLLSKVINSAKKYAPAVVGSFNPAAGKLLQSVVSKLSRKAVKPKQGPSKPKATSAEASGITARKPRAASKKPPTKRAASKPRGKS